MPYSKTILCLASSRKDGGRCIAGKELLPGGRTGHWIRPVSAREGEEISEKECSYEDGSSASVLDVIQIPMREPRPRSSESYQSENHLIDGDICWKRIGVVSWQEVLGAIDMVPGALWKNGCHIQNDRIPEAQARQEERSLFLIKPEDLVIHVVDRAEYNRDPQVRAKFGLNGQCYNLAVTDPEIERCYSVSGSACPISGALLCISLGEIYPHDNCAYKLIAAVIMQKTAQQNQ